MDHYTNRVCWPNSTNTFPPSPYPFKFLIKNTPKFTQLSFYITTNFKTLAIIICHWTKAVGFSRLSTPFLTPSPQFIIHKVINDLKL